MYRRDYILRLIERFGRALLALRDRILRREADTAEVAARIGEVAHEAGVDLALARQLDPASLLMWLAPGDDVDQPRLWLVAELLYLAGLQAEAAGSGGGRGDFERALAIHSRLPPAWRPAEGLSTAGERAAELQDLLTLS